MEVDTKKIDDMILALLYLTSFDETEGVARTWKTHDWSAMDRLFEKGFITDPKRKTKSVILTEKGFRRSKALFEKYFAKKK